MEYGVRNSGLSDSSRTLYKRGENNQVLYLYDCGMDIGTYVISVRSTVCVGFWSS